MTATVFIEGLDLGSSATPPAVSMEFRAALTPRRVGASIRKRRRRLLTVRLVAVRLDDSLAWAAPITRRARSGA